MRTRQPRRPRHVRARLGPLVVGSVLWVWASATAPTPSSTETTAPAAVSGLTNDHRYLAVGGFGTPLISMVGVTRAGEMSLVPGSPFPTGLAPLALAITPDARTLYSTHTGSGTIVGYRIEHDGTLTALPDASVAVGAPAVGAAITPDGERLFVTTGPSAEAGGLGAVQSYSIAPSGALTRTGAAAVPVDSSLSQVAITPDARHLVVTNFTADTVVSFAIGQDARLTQLGEPLAAGTHPVMPAFTPDGRFVYVSNEDSGDVSGYAVGQDGTLTPTPGSPYDAGSLPHGTVATSDSRRLYAPDAEGSAVLGWRIEADGRLAPLPGAPYPTPGMAGRVVLSPDDRRLFQIQSIATDNPEAHSYVHGYALDGDGRPVDDGRPPVDTGIVFHDGTTAFFTPNQGPVAKIELTGASGESRTFSASGSTDTDGQVVRYEWDFGDGERITTTSPSVSHTYRTPGPWRVRVTVTDDENCSTQLIFQGTTVNCRGGDSARAELTVRP